MNYFERTADTLLRDFLEVFGAVLIEGPKWCGKTTTAEQQAKSVLYMQDPDYNADNLVTASTKPSLLLAGDTPRLIDEWQDAPVLWDAVRTAVDRRGLPGQFILTGSNTVDDTKIKHSGTGRIVRMQMHPMSLWESHESSGKISINELFDNQSLDIDGAESSMTIEQLIYAACRGGWPATLNANTEKAALMVAKSYVKSVCSTDISRVDGVKRNEKLAHAILKSYARNISTLAKTSSMLADVVGDGKRECTRPTFDDYVAALEKVFVIQDIDAWCPAIRSKASMRSGLKRCFCDPSIATALLEQTPQSLLTQLKTFGFIFEQMCIRDLKAYTAGFDGHVSYYHDRYGLEADIVLHLEDGRYALIECKLGGSEIDKGAENLKKIAYLVREHNKIEQQMPIREPDLLVILTGGTLAYTRSDGVKVIPLATLRP